MELSAVEAQRREGSDNEGGPAWASKDRMGFGKSCWVPLTLSLSERVGSQSRIAYEYVEEKLTIGVEKY